MVRLKARTPPPSDYYANNVRRLVTNVCNRYGDILTPEEARFGKSVLSLSETALRLLARIISRKRPLLRVSTLQYDEVGETDAPLSELCELDLVSLCPTVDVDEILSMLNRRELSQRFPIGFSPPDKQSHVSALIEHFGSEQLTERLRRSEPWVRFEDSDALRIFTLLYFGRAHVDLTAFVLRDLGLVRYEPVPLNSSQRRFSTRHDMERYIELVDFGEEAYDASSDRDPKSLSSIAELIGGPEPDRFLEHRRCRLLNSVARGLERCGEYRAAVETYGRSSLPPARERQARLLSKLGEQQKSQNIIDAIRSGPSNLDELEFALTFQKRRTGAVDIPTSKLKLRKAVDTRIETHAQLILETKGASCWHLENALPMSLFGLAYWEWIYAPVPGAFDNEFQASPTDLFWPDFCKVRSQQCVDPLTDGEPIAARILRTSQEKRGVANRLVNWRALTRDVLHTVVHSVPDDDLRRLLSIVKQDLDQARSGFPDLTVVYESGKYEFVEVKAPGDRVQRNQRIWINRLHDAGLPVRVMQFDMMSSDQQTATKSPPSQSQAHAT